MMIIAGAVEMGRGWPHVRQLTIMRAIDILGGPGKEEKHDPKFAAQEFFEFLFGQFPLADTTVAKSIHQRQLFVQCGIAQRRFRHGFIERC